MAACPDSRPTGFVAGRSVTRPWNTLGRFVCWLGAVGVAEKIKRHKKKIFFAACHDGLASVQTKSESLGLSLLTSVTSALVSSFTCLNQHPVSHIVFLLSYGLGPWLQQ